MANKTAEVLEVVKTMPGVGTNDIHDLCPHIPAKQVASILTRLHALGKVSRVLRDEIDGTGTQGRQAYLYSHVEHVSRKVTGRPPKAAQPEWEVVRANLVAEIAILHEEMAVMEQWKHDAIERFPDLAVSAAVIEARQVVADTFASLNDIQGAKEARCGRRDTTPIMLAVLRALGGDQ